MTWHKYDHDNKTNNILPVAGELVYIFEENVDGVDMGYWDYGWWCHWTGSDDISVIAWHPFEFPAVPKEIDHWHNELISRYDDQL